MSWLWDYRSIGLQEHSRHSSHLHAFHLNQVRCEATQFAMAAAAANQNEVGQFAKLADSSFVRFAGVPKRIAGSYSDFRRLNGNDFSTLCKNLVSFGPVGQVKICSAGVDPNSYPIISSSIYAELIFIKFSGLLEAWEILIKHSSILRSLKGRCMAINFVAKIAKLPIPPLFDALAFRNELQDHNFDFRRFN